MRTLGYLPLAVATLMVGSATPAQAIGAGVIVFSGYAVVSPLGNPELSATFPNPVIKPSSPVRSWRFESFFGCSGVTAAFLKPAQPPVTVYGAVPGTGFGCNINVGGIMTAGEVQRTLDPVTCAETLVGCTPAAVLTGFGAGPFCGASGGAEGTGSLVIQGQTFHLLNVGWMQSAATVILVQGTIRNPTNGVQGSLVALVDAVPYPFNSGECSLTTETEFLIAGTSVALMPNVS